MDASDQAGPPVFCKHKAWKLAYPRERYLAFVVLYLMPPMLTGGLALLAEGGRWLVPAV